VARSRAAQLLLWGRKTNAVGDPLATRTHHTQTALCIPTRSAGRQTAGRVLKTFYSQCRIHNDLTFIPAHFPKRYAAIAAIANCGLNFKQLPINITENHI